ncbi:hypothetical protein KMZ32_16135 [Phycicoccus sp. MAQZ13P-2]|uniref:YdeI/OmpD-associated family protein n=1 Tax=Phycicoccus mangrovi TaxID=2840470 RepID=UPI001C007DAF|nr:hypothetical protein [Phycicoccus mangrovi]MBT9253979.1 hypothetical protein [Phycicoccus mangrovi]MBT9275608.1 hypothetical protein [Phycicoccus mangrovi]
MTPSEPVLEFPDRDALWAWLTAHHESDPGGWVRLARARSGLRSVTVEELLEAGIAFGWSESTRRRYDERSYLQRFTPRRGRGTTSERNRRIADRLEAEGRMTPAGRRALAVGAAPGAR